MLRLEDPNGDEIPPPSDGLFRTTIDPDQGGFLIFDYVSAEDFKFAGLDPQGRWVIGERTETGWNVPQDSNSRVAADLSAGGLQTIQVLFGGNGVDGKSIELWAGPAAGNPTTRAQPVV